MNPKIILRRVFPRALAATVVFLPFLVTSCQKEAEPALTSNTAVPSGVTLNTTFKNATALSTFLGTTVKYSAPISLYKKSNITITGLSITGGSVPCIQLTGCTNIHIKKCKITGTTNYGILIGSGCSNILIDSCLINNVATGVFAVSCPAGQIRIQHNQFQNMKGPYPKALLYSLVMLADRVTVSNIMCARISRDKATPKTASASIRAMACLPIRS